MSKSKRKSTVGWSQCKQAMRSWPRSGLVALIHEMYRLSDENRRFLHGRLLPQKSADTLESAAKVVRRMLAPTAVLDERFRHNDVKRLIDQFAKAVDDPAAVARLLLVDLAAALSTFSQIGDDETIVDHIYSTMNRLDGVLKKLDATAALPLVEELAAIARRWSSEFGWGVSDELHGLAWEWGEKFGLGDDEGEDAADRCAAG